ncbi:MAG TPA: universal stress protein [Kofleriaceae bacterium]|nr:universal stress protein [Kofleriaceae bacterium]
MTFKKILCPIDFSPGSQQAMGVAVRLATASNAELVLAHAWYLPPLAYGGEYPVAPEAVQILVDDEKRGLEDAARDAAALGARRVETRLLSGVPWQQLVELLRADTGFDLVVMGTHGRTGLSRFLLGSVTENVVRQAPCPVLVVRSQGAGTFGHVLCPVDFSACSREAVELAAAVAAPGGAGITLLHVIELPVSYSGEPPVAGFAEDLDRASARLLDQWSRELATKVSVPVATRSRIGSPGAQILAVLESDPTFDLVVMGSHGRTGVRRMLLGSVAEKVVRHAACPVLVTHSRQAAAEHRAPEAGAGVVTQR